MLILILIVEEDIGENEFNPSKFTLWRKCSSKEMMNQGLKLARLLD